MSIGIVGRKCGMSRIFTENGESVPVTLIEATPNRIVQIKTQDADGYQAVQVTAGEKRAALVTKPLAGHYAKAKVEPGESLVEFRLADGEETFGWVSPRYMETVQNVSHLFRDRWLSYVTPRFLGMGRSSMALFSPIDGSFDSSLMSLCSPGGNDNIRFSAPRPSRIPTR